MALNSSGPISLGGSTTGQSINLELGQGATDTVSLNDASVRTLAGISSGEITMPTNFYGKSSIPQGNLIIEKKSYPPSTTSATFNINPTLGGGNVSFTGSAVYNNSTTWGPQQLFDDTRTIFDWAAEGGPPCFAQFVFAANATVSTIFIIPRSQGDNFPPSVTVSVNGTPINTYYPTTLTLSSGQQINYTGIGYKIQPGLSGNTWLLSFNSSLAYIGEIEFWGSYTPPPPPPFSFTFSPCGQTGPTGPTLATCLGYYNTVSNPWLLDATKFDVIGGVQIWTVPSTGNYIFDVKGARGGQNGFGPGGSGAQIVTRIYLEQGQKISLVVGQSGIDHPNNEIFRSGPGGGGGSFVYTLNPSTNQYDLYVAAGGGGGAQTSDINLITTVSDANGKTGQNGTSITDAGGYFASGGTGGSGGDKSSRNILYGGAGAGWLSNGTGSYAGKTRVSGWFGGGVGQAGTGRQGGFGGGGASFDESEITYAWAGGGGGYSGGAPGHNGGVSDGQFGGGGGSYYTGTLISATAGANYNTGSITVTKV